MESFFFFSSKEVETFVVNRCFKKEPNFILFVEVNEKKKKRVKLNRLNSDDSYQPIYGRRSSFLSIWAPNETGKQPASEKLDVPPTEIGNFMEVPGLFVVGDPLNGTGTITPGPVQSCLHVELKLHLDPLVKQNPAGCPTLKPVACDPCQSSCSGPVLPSSSQ